MQNDEARKTTHMPLTSSQGNRKEKTPPGEAFLDEATCPRRRGSLRALRSRMDGIARHQPVSDPLVEGMRPSWRGSISIAARKARARALKQDSAM